MHYLNTRDTLQLWSSAPRRYRDIPLGITAKQLYAEAKVVPFLALPYLHSSLFGTSLSAQVTQHWMEGCANAESRGFRRKQSYQ